MSQRIRKNLTSYAGTIACFVLSFLFYAACFAHMK